MIDQTKADDIKIKIEINQLRFRLLGQVNRMKPNQHTMPKQKVRDLEADPKENGRKT